MTSIDELFNKQGFSGGKRKFDADRNAEEVYKSAKLEANGDVKGKGRATVEDEVDDDDDVEAGPALPPGEDDLDPDDEEGRFFGGGITQDTAEALDFIDELDQGAAAPEKIDAAWVRKMALNFEKRISKNAELRAKHENDPQKFMSSEADLDADIKALSILSEHPHLYEEFVKLGCVNSLVSLLAHENTDIAIDAMEIISELIDEDVAAEQEQWDAIVNAMLDAGLLDLAVQNFERLDEQNESDRSGVYYALSVLENLASQQSIAEKISLESTVFKWISRRIQKKETPVSQNKQYAAELLSILLQSSSKNRKHFAEIDGVDLVLQLLSAYRKKDPEKGGDEEEYVENLFDGLTCVMEEVEGKDKFIEAEGIELCIIMLKGGKLSRSRALRVLDHAMGGQHGAGVCAKVIEAGGLGTIFGLFMKKDDKEMIEHLLGMFESLLRLLPYESDPRIRVLAKFMEGEYGKIGKLLTLRERYQKDLAAVDRQIERERAALSEEDQEAMADEWYSRRLDSGIFCARTLDLVIAWLVAEDDGARSEISKRLGEQGHTLSDVKRSLQERLDEMEGGDESEELVSAKEMLTTLMQFL
ncbi:DUF1716-domain-containing protein [Xylona heveae TC161]|uniref:DUF1716-domain-containing protein n=1 Tax=Xylona heveae (strain CBS 132557 / TC161) TaxID=1328760 RepID=A0A165I2X9_XYLHT|nr:DUF1716-domain-containing protein [Xylona heveae TC161]KZF24298.1 DUF1716-domain-containing protein [Xylona heveae TC161]